MLEVNVYDSSIDIYDFLFPIKKFTRYTTSFQPKSSESVRTDIVMNDIEMRTNRGFYFKDYQQDLGVEIQEIRNDRMSRTETPTSNPPYWHIELSSGDSHLEIERNYKGVFYVFAGVGGMSRGISMMCVLVYFFYNHYHYVKYLILGNIVANEDKYAPNYQLKSNYLKFWLYSIPCCCCRDKKVTTDPEFVQKMETYEACEKLLSTRLSIENFINDGMELEILRGLLLKERHKMLLPVLCINLIKKKDRESK